MEKQLAKKPLIKGQYCESMRNAELNGYIEKVPSIEELDGYYMPHYVLKNDSTTTKVRVVFNSSDNFYVDDLKFGALELYKILEVAVEKYLEQFCITI